MKRRSPKSPFPVPRLPKAAGGEASRVPDASSFAPGVGLCPGPRLKASARLCSGGMGASEQRGRWSSEGPRRRRGSRSPGGRGGEKIEKEHLEGSELPCLGGGGGCPQPGPPSVAAPAAEEPLSGSLSPPKSLWSLRVRPPHPNHSPPHPSSISPQQAPAGFPWRLR